MTNLKPEIGATTGRKLFRSGVLALALFVGAVLPAEFGIDPTGFGKWSGLVALAAEPNNASDFSETRSFNVEDYDTKAEEIDRSIRGLISLQETPFKSETILIEVDDLGEVEHKFFMAQDMTLVYAWKVLNPQGEGVYYDFHGHPRAADVGNFPDGFEMAYSKSEGTAQNGAFTAPFGGLHGFYFMNLEEGPITIELTVSGFYDSHQEVYRAVDGEVLTRLDL